MTTQDGHELCSLLTKISPLRSSLYSVKGFKIKREYALLQSELIMVESLTMRAFTYSMKRMKFFITSLLQEHINKMFSLQEMTKTMLNDNFTPKHFWAEAANTDYYL